MKRFKHILAATLCQHPGVVLKGEHLQSKLFRLQGVGVKKDTLDNGMDVAVSDVEEFDRRLSAYERQLLEKARRRCKTQKDMAQCLKISEARLHRLLKKHGLLGHRPKAAANRAAQPATADRER